jgi:hypothetical protein
MTFDDYVAAVDVWVLEVFTTGLDHDDLEYVMAMMDIKMLPESCAAEVVKQRMKECEDD